MRHICYGILIAFLISLTIDASADAIQSTRSDLKQIRKERQLLAKKRQSLLKQLKQKDQKIVDKQWELKKLWFAKEHPEAYTRFVLHTKNETKLRRLIAKYDAAHRVKRNPNSKKLVASSTLKTNYDEVEEELNRPEWVNLRDKRKQEIRLRYTAQYRKEKKQLIRAFKARLQQAPLRERGEVKREYRTAKQNLKMRYYREITTAMLNN